MECHNTPEITILLLVVHIVKEAAICLALHVTPMQINSLYATHSMFNATGSDPWLPFCLLCRCSVCVDTNGTCGWCVLDFSCTASDSFCSSGVFTRRTVSNSRSDIVDMSSHSYL